MSHVLLIATCALSPDGKAGFETSFRRGTTRVEMASSEGRARPKRYFRGSVNRTVTTLHVTSSQGVYQHKPIYNPMRTSMNNDTKNTNKGRRCLPKSSAGKRTIHSSGRFKRILQLTLYYSRLPMQLSTDFLVNRRDFMKKRRNSSFLGGSRLLRVVAPFCAHRIESVRLAVNYLKRRKSGLHYKKRLIHSLWNWFPGKKSILQE